MKRVAFIGHRNIFDKTLKDRLKKEVQNLIDSGYTTFTMGTHGDFDKMSLEVCREFRKHNPDIQIEVVITSLHTIEHKIEDDTFGKAEYTPYEDVQTIMYEIEDVYFKKQITESNKQMIDNSDILVCYVNNKSLNSGSKRAYNYAKKKGLQIVNLFTSSSALNI